MFLLCVFVFAALKRIIVVNVWVIKMVELQCIVAKCLGKICLELTMSQAPVSCSCDQSRAYFCSFFYVDRVAMFIFRFSYLGLWTLLAMLGVVSSGWLDNNQLVPRQTSTCCNCNVSKCEWLNLII